jgi:hypothetical protein
MFYAHEHIFGGAEGIGSRFHVLRAALVFRFCAPGIISRGTEGVGSRFQVLRSQTRFRRDRVHRVPFSNFALPNSFSALLRASALVFMFCAPELVFCSTEGIGSHFHALRAQTHFPRYRGRWVSFSSFALPDTFSTVRRASGPVFMICAPVLIFGGNKVVGSHFQVLCSMCFFTRYRGHRVPF